MNVSTKIRKTWQITTWIHLTNWVPSIALIDALTKTLIRFIAHSPIWRSRFCERGRLRWQERLRSMLQCADRGASSKRITINDYNQTRRLCIFNEWACSHKFFLFVELFILIILLGIIFSMGSHRWSDGENTKHIYIHIMIIRADICICF